MEQLSASRAVRPGDGADKQFDGSAHLSPKLVGDLGLGICALGKERLQGLVCRDPKEPPQAKDRHKRVKQRALFGDQIRGPRGPAGRGVAWRVDQREALGVSYKCQRDIRLTAERGSPLDRRRCPAVGAPGHVGREPPVEGRVEGPAADEQPRLRAVSGGRRHEHEVGPQGHAIFGHGVRHAGRDRRPFDQLGAVFEQVRQDEAEPGGAGGLVAVVEAVE